MSMTMKKMRTVPVTLIPPKIVDYEEKIQN